MPPIGNEGKKVVAVIPARYRSTRFPGKPLAQINGLPMLVHVYRAVAKCGIFDWITVGTDDERIGGVCDEHGIPWVMTSSDHPTGTDRVAEVARQLEATIYVNIQGAEPMLKPEVIEAAVRPLLEDTNQRLLVTNLCAPISDPSGTYRHQRDQGGPLPGRASRLSIPPTDSLSQVPTGGALRKTGMRVWIPPRATDEFLGTRTGRTRDCGRHRVAAVHRARHASAILRG